MENTNMQLKGRAC